MNNLPFFKKFLLTILLGFIFINPTLASAQTNSSVVSKPEYQGVEGSIQSYLCTPSNPPDGHDLERCINRAYRFGISFGAIAVVFFVVLAGYIYITGGEAGKAKAKGILQNALVGIGILLGSYVLLSFINPALVVIKPIQPPIFSAANLPKCADVGLGERCVLPNGGISSGGGDRCALPIASSSENGKFNGSIHGRDGHGPVRSAPNSPGPEGIVDVGGKGGSPVYAAISGKVVKIASLGKFGSYASIISDPQGDAYGCQNSSSCSNQAHVDFSVSEGAMVTAGQQIGVLTNYSGGMGPHLHQELKIGGQWVTGDGFKGTWTNMKSAIARCQSNSGSGGGGSSAVAVDMSKAPSGMVEVTESSHGVKLNLKYATSDNFTGTALYKQGKCYLTATASSQLKRAQTALSNKNKTLELLDCYRPRAVQDLMIAWAKDKVSWAGKQAPQPNNYLTVPYIATGGKHPLGQAIDLTISGASMPSRFDEFSTKGYYNANNADAKLLRDTMVGAGFGSYNNEWWHFNE